MQWIVTALQGVATQPIAGAAVRIGNILLKPIQMLSTFVPWYILGTMATLLSFLVIIAIYRAVKP